MLWPTKNSYKEFDNEKKFLRLENSPSPHNFSNGSSLNPLEPSVRYIGQSPNDYLSKNTQGVAILVRLPLFSSIFSIFWGLLTRRDLKSTCKHE